MVDSPFGNFFNCICRCVFALAPFGFDYNLGQHFAKGVGDNLLVAVSADKDRHKSLLFHQSPAYALAN